MPIQLIDIIKPKNDGDFPMAEDTEFLGGWRVVADITARDAIPSLRRKEGMQVHVISEEKIFELKGGITNSDWKEATGSIPSEGVVLATREDLTFPIDYNDAGAVDAPAGTVFATQAEINDYLTSQGASNFKHLYSAIKTLPQLVQHEVDFNLASGTHFADPASTAYSTFYCMPLFGFTVDGGGIVRVNGRPMSEWTQIVAPQTITAFQESSDDPWVQVGGTPFAGQDLRGRMAILSNGVYGIINEHDDNTLHLMRAISPNPVVATDTVFVGRPNASLRNAYVGTPTTRAFSYLVYLNHDSGEWGSNVEFADLQFDAMGAFRIISPGGRGNRSAFRRIIIDHEYQRTQFSITPAGSIASAWENNIDFYDVGAYASDANQIDGYALLASHKSSFFAYYTYVCNARRGSQAYNFGILYFRNYMLDSCGTASYPSLELYENGGFQGFDMGGKVDEIRGSPGIGIRLRSKSWLARADYQRFVLKDITGPCVKVVDRSDFLIASYWIKDGGGNLDVGFELKGPFANVVLNSATDVTGANGDVRMADGGILSYTDIVASGPYSDSSYNWIEKS